MMIRFVLILKTLCLALRYAVTLTPGVIDTVWSNDTVRRIETVTECSSNYSAVRSGVVGMMAVGMR